MIEQGQPLHAFDADVLEKKFKKVINVSDFGLRNAREGEILLLLDGQEKRLNNSNLVITCNEEVIALAGIMGGLETSVTEETKRIWLESAMFDSTAIRVSSRSLGIRTEASSRFEKGVPIETTITSANRAIQLISSEIGGNINGKHYYGLENYHLKVINLRRESIHKLLGPLNSDLDQFDDKTQKKINSIYQLINPYSDLQRFI